MSSTPLPPFKSITIDSAKPGPKLLVTGAVHGNEIHGTLAMQKLIAEFDAGTRVIARGAVTFVPITNPLAFVNKRRNGDRNLNRNLVPTREPKEFEDHVANWICPIMQRHDVLLDLHSFQAQGVPFALIGPPDNQDDLEPFAKAKLEEDWVRVLGVSRVVHGWLSTYAKGVHARRARITDERARLLCDEKYGVGTTEYMRSVGGAAITLECGQHDDPNGPTVAYNAIVNSLAHFGLIDAPKPAPATNIECLHLLEVIDRDDMGDTFAKPWTSFDALAQGELIGTRKAGGTLQAPDAGRIVFPNVNSTPGTEWFYFAQHDDRLG
jgi:predicted deacylase